MTESNTDYQNLYVNGFCFNPERTHVALIRKVKPEWQKGLMNGVGGKIKVGERPSEAMNREWSEETKTEAVSWREYAKISVGGNTIYFFAGTMPRVDFPKMELGEEQVEWVRIYDATNSLRVIRVVPNLQWLIPMALDNELATADITYTCS